VSGRCVPGYRWHEVFASGGFMPGLPLWGGRVAVAADGTIYVAWSDPDSLPRLVAFTASGAERWSRSFSAASDRVDDLVVTSDGTVIVAATYSAGIWRSPGRSTHRSEGDFDDLAVIALDASGSVEWEYFIDSDGVDEQASLAAADGRVIVTASVGGTFDYGGGPLRADTFRDLLVLELAEADGAYVDARVYGAAGTERPGFGALAPGGDIIVGGTTGAGVSFGGGPTSSYHSGFVARLGSGMAHVWSRSLDVEDVWGVTTDAGGDVYVTGLAERAPDFGGGVTLPSGGQFLLALDGASGEARWARGLGDAYLGPRSHGPVVDADGTVWVAASVTGGLGFDDALLAAYEPSGRPVYERRFGSTTRDEATGLAVGPGTLVLAGRFSGSGELGGSRVTSSDYDLFVVVFDL